MLTAVAPHGAAKHGAVRAQIGVYRHGTARLPPSSLTRSWAHRRLADVETRRPKTPRARAEVRNAERRATEVAGRQRATAADPAT
jgi:hypothetical protein